MPEYSLDKYDRGSCKACGSKIQLSLHQMRAADEPSTEVWSCGNCPLEESRIKFSHPSVGDHSSYPRSSHRHSIPLCVSVEEPKTLSLSYAELSLYEMPVEYAGIAPVDNVRVSLAVDIGNGRKLPAYFYPGGVHAGASVYVKSRYQMSPKCDVVQIDTYASSGPSGTLKSEKDGVMRLVRRNGETDVYIYSRYISTKTVHTAVIMLDSSDRDKRHSSLVSLHSIQSSWPSIRDFASRDYVSSVNNLSPRAWDSKRVQKKGAVYSPKTDGERAYVIIYRGVAHMFSKGKGYRHIGWRVLEVEQHADKPIVVDVENTLSYGCFFIDMLTDRRGAFSPKIRDYEWSLREMLWLIENSNLSFISLKPYYATLKEAEHSCTSSLYPTDGVIALWKGDTTARKMKQERSIELLLDTNGNLVTSEGDVVIEDVSVPAGIEVGDILEVRFKLDKNGKGIKSRELFKRTDKVSANSTSAVLGVLESFSHTARTDETRRRNVTMWCESLRSLLVKEAVKKCGDRRIIMDIGSGTGQSLDSLTTSTGISYILVEPDEGRCEQLRTRAGVKKVCTEPRDILSNLRGLKSGSINYIVMQCQLSQIVSDEWLMSSINGEIGAVTATFSAQYVVSDLYDLSTYWSIPVVGCFYPYDNVPVSGCLVSSLGVEMRRDSERECSVRWGSDKRYTEPCTFASEYQGFSSVRKGIGILQPPGKNVDDMVFEICSKVYVIL